MMDHTVSISEKTTSLNLPAQSYTSTKTYTYGKNAPPAYEQMYDKKVPDSNTLFQSIQHARNGAYSVWDRMRKCGTFFCCSVSMIVILLVLMAIPVTLIVIGSLNTKNCAIQRFLPMWLIIAGSSTLIKNVVTLIVRIKALKSKSEKSDSTSTIVNVCDSIIALFLLVWFICGNVWVYSIQKQVQHTDSSASDYCDKLTYLAAFWVITAIYILIGLSCLLFCCTVCFTIFLSPKK